MDIYGLSISAEFASTVESLPDTCKETESGVFLLDSVVSPGGEWTAPTALRATCSARQQMQ
jgi:hypothetical protein